jgi:hypothetical protein
MSTEGPAALHVDTPSPPHSFRRDSMYGLQPNGMWPVRSVFPPGGPYHPPC